MNYSLLRAVALGNVWAIEESYMEKLCFVLNRKFSDERLSAEEIAAIKYDGPLFGSMQLWSIDTQVFVPAVAANQDGSSPVMAAAGGGSGGGPVLAVLNITGVLAQHSRQVQNLSGPTGTSTEQITNSFRSAMADPNVKALVLNIDSPGGNVYGIQALADEIFKARGTKPIIAQANSTTASAAYWLATQADEIVATPGAQVGSVGAYTVHEDHSKKLENDGVKITYVAAGKHKVDGNRASPLSPDASERLQKMVDTYYGEFTSSVARGRGVKTSDVRNGYGEGGMEHSTAALRLGMIDRIATLDQTLKRVASMKARPEGLAARAETITLETRAANEATEVHLVGEFPPLLAVSGALLANIDAPHVVWNAETGSLLLMLANASAAYQFVSRDIATDVSTFARVSLGSAIQTKSAVDALLAGVLTNNDARAALGYNSIDGALIDAAAVAADLAAKGAAFRKRRHAHRMRMP